MNKKYFKKGYHSAFSYKHPYGPINKNEIKVTIDLEIQVYSSLDVSSKNLEFC